MLAFGGGALAAEDWLRPDFHGFVTQSLIVGSGDNYLGMSTTCGSAAWTEAAANVNNQFTDNLRAGAQIHLMKLGQFGRWGTSVDWALVDFKARHYLGVRAGVVKIRWGLYNETQDADPGYLWSLLPEPMYAVDWRATNLSQTGAELYGSTNQLGSLGSLDYSLYYGHYYYSRHDGYMEGFRQSGLSFANQPGGKTPGFDLRWNTPAPGLMLGGSLMVYNANAKLMDGTFRQPLTYWPTYYAQLEHRKFWLAGQYMKLVQYTNTAVEGIGPSSSLSDTRAWFALAGYHVSGKLQAGVYYTRYIVASAHDPSDPANRYRDAVVSARYDFNSNFYLKLEGHRIDGTGLGFYAFDNPDGLKPRSHVVVAKLGFSF